MNRGRRLFGLCRFAVEPDNKARLFSRKFLGALTLEATWMEETLDYYGSQHNVYWSRFRKVMAAAKMFSSVSYTLCHILKALPSYHLLDISRNFGQEGEAAGSSLTGALVIIAQEILKVQTAPDQSALPRAEDFEEATFTGKLDRDVITRPSSDPNITLISLATTFLNQSGDFGALVTAERKPSEYPGCFPDKISEEKLRTFKAQFHNLQSSYDTYLSQTDLENGDQSILPLRGHVSIIYHLLEAAAGFSHYYERHIVAVKTGDDSEGPFLPLSRDHHLALLFDFFLAFAGFYFLATKQLCRNLIAAYSEKDEITVGIPQYRGFHVRPSTFIASIVEHYGSKVTMTLNGEEYDAGTAFDLFRANEQISMAKKAYIKDRAASEGILANLGGIDQKYWPGQVQLLILKLMDENVINLSSGKSLSLEGVLPKPEEDPYDYFQRVITRFMNFAKIDINQQDLRVTFAGDKRVLRDIKALAEAGYGEDRNGNNTHLPAQLTYLKRNH
ncbi:MAG: hypothetical protein LBQ61_04140 [Spirochaetales bacterium]|nr:hypothetical protein [Spirochaetales bacterium]